MVLAPTSYDFSKTSSQFKGKFWKPRNYLQESWADNLTVPLNLNESGVRYYDFNLKQVCTLANLSGKFSYFSKEATKGNWRGFRLEMDLPRGSFNGIPGYGYLGALFGNTLYQVLKLAQPVAPVLYHGMFELWLKMLKTSGPTFYEVTNLSVTIVDTNPTNTHSSSLSTQDNLSLRHLLLSEDWDISEYFDGLLDTFKSGPLFERLRLAFAFSSLLRIWEKNGFDRIQQSGTIFGSDQVAIYDFLHPRDSTDLIRISFYFSKYYPNLTPEYLSSRFSGTNPFAWKREQEQFQTLARKVRFPARNSNIPTGCGGCQAPVFRIFAKSKKIRGKLIFNPIGLPKGKNCILECVEYYLRENQTYFELHSSQVHYHPEIMVLLGLSDTLDLSDESVRATLTKITKISFVVFMEQIEDGVSTIVQLPWQLNPDSPDGIQPLRLLVFNHGTDLFGFKVWHACIVQDFSMLRDKRKCNICGEWFSRESKHFKNCRVCTGCGKFYQEDGKHYASCRGKVFEVSKAKETGMMAISNISHHKNQLKKDIWFADFECFQDKNGRHIPYMAALKCVNNNDTKVFWGQNCLQEFIEFITTPAKGVKGYLYCHNGSGYDFNIILVGLLKYSQVFTKKPVSVLMRGTKILTCQISTKPNLVLRDTFLLIPTALAKICKDLKIKQEFAKLHFDHSKIFSFESAEKHKEEVIKYCIQDVVALDQIFSMFANAMWDIAPVLLQSSMSLASHALEMWKIMEKGPVLSTLALPDYETYLVLREMYHGGRVLATVPKYDSALFSFVTETDDNENFTFFDEEGRTLMDFDEIIANSQQLFKKGRDKEFLKQVDVVSLYPHCMYEKKYPTGAFIPPVEFSLEDGQKLASDMMATIKSGKWANFEHDGDNVRVEQEHYSHLKEEMFRHCYQITMDCPQDLIVAFVMRKENGSPIQNLNPLEKHWITGVELFEAIRIGYKLKTVHCKFGWESSNFVFKKYIGALFSIKEKFKHDKSNIMYLCSKLLMNALSGKFGQKIVCRVTKLMSELPDDPEKEFENLLNISNELIEAMDGKELEPVGYLFTGDKRTADMETNLPTHLSVFILAYSRRKMSKMLRFVGGYTDPENTLLYTDTDSMVVTQSTFSKYVAKGWIGSKLGQLDDEYPNNLIVSARFLAPKVYCLMMLKQLPDSPKAAIYYKIRCKGIPHLGEFFANSYELDDREFKVRVAEIDDSISSGVKDLGKRFYVVKSKEKDEIVMVNPFINIHICDLILTEKFYLQVHFGSILKQTKVKFQLISKWVTRSLGVNSWWNNPKCPRILKDEEGYVITSCKGKLLDE